MKWILGQRKLLWVANLALFATLGYIASGFLMDNDAGQDVTPALTLKNVITDSKIVAEPVKTEDNDLILERNIFATATTAPTETAVPKEETPKPVEPTPQPTLNLKLIATIAGDKDFARAVIQNTKTSKQNLYRTGDVIDGATIDLIERNTITLTHAGNQQTLNISAGKTTPALAKAKTNFAKSVNITSPTHREIYRNSKFARNGGISAAFKAFQAIPTEIDEKTKGLKITGLEKSSLAKHVGLKNGDIITKINGQTPTNKRVAFQILKSAKRRSKLDLNLLQNNKQKKLSFEMI